MDCSQNALKCGLLGRRDVPASTSAPDGESAAQEPDRWLVFEVSDTGCGVARDGLRSLFKEYVQVSPLHTTLSTGPLYGLDMLTHI